MAVNRSRFDPSVEAKNTIIDLITNLRDDIFTSSEERGDLTAVEFFFRNCHHERIMMHLVNKLLPYKKEIVAKNINFFEDNSDTIFAGLPEDRVNYYSKIITSGKRISTEYRSTIWEYFDSLIALAELYQKNK